MSENKQIALGKYYMRGLIFLLENSMWDGNHTDSNEDGYNSIDGYLEDKEADIKAAEQWIKEDL